MMEWRKDDASKYSSTPPMITRVFPTWLRKLKQESGNAKTKTAKAKQKEKMDGILLCTTLPATRKEGKLHGGIDEENRIGGASSVWYGSDDDIEVRMMSSCCSWRSRSRSEDNWRFNDMVPEVRKIRELLHKEGIMLEEDDLPKGTKARELKFKVSKDSRAVKDQESRASSGKGLREREVERKRRIPKEEEEEETLQSPKKVETKDDSQKPGAPNSRRQRRPSCPSFSLTTIQEDCTSESLESKIKATMSRSEQQGKSVYIIRENQNQGRRQNSRIKNLSPRILAKSECKIKALEDMKRTKKAMRKKRFEKRVETKTDFHSYAVFKCSLDPEQDFRYSILEMIIDKGIIRRKELQELLVCYLTLNCDHHHELIIKVFRQVWFELNQVHL